jgi:hypothetical protein
MELTYLVRGADGKQYGPVTLEQMDGWIKEGRLAKEAEVKRSDIEYWAAASEYQELQPIFGGPAPGQAAAATAPVPTGVRKAPAAAPTAQLKSGASWFYWVAGLSLINSISAFSGSTWRFILGLGITQIIDAFGSRLETGGKLVSLALDLCVAGLFILFGFLGNKGHTWAFLVGMVLFALDGLIFLLFQDWLGVGFHVLVLYWLFRGFNACRQLKAAG